MVNPPQQMSADPEEKLHDAVDGRNALQLCRRPGVACGEGFFVFGGLGTLLGLGIDAAIPGRMRVVYRAPGSGGVASARLSIAPFVTSRTKGVALAVTF